MWQWFQGEKKNNYNIKLGKKKDRKCHSKTVGLKQCL